MEAKVKNFWKFLGDFLRIISIILVAFVLNTIILLLTKKDVALVYSSMFNGAFGDMYNIARTIRWSLPLVFTGLSFAVSSRSGIFNIGAEGQLYLGAFAAAWVGFTFVTLPAWLLIPLAILAGMVAGSLFSLLAGWITQQFNTSIIVVSLMLNYIALLFTEYLVRYPFYVRGGLGESGSTQYIAEAAFLKTVIPGSNVTTAIYLAIVAAIIIALLNNFTVVGYETRIIGGNSNFARFSGLPVKRRNMMVFAISGGLAGLGGALEVLGVHHRFIVKFASGLGFDGIVVSLLASGNPLLTLISALFMGAMTSGSIAVEMFGKVPKSMTDIMMGLIILTITIQYNPKFIQQYRLWIANFKHAKERNL